MAAGTIEDCFYSVITARKIAETFNMVVVVLSDASLATSNQPFTRPEFDPAWLAPPIDQSASEGAQAYDWDATTGSSSASFRGSRTACTRSRGLRTIARVTWLAIRRSTSSACTCGA